MKIKVFAIQPVVQFAIKVFAATQLAGNSSYFQDFELKVEPLLLFTACDT